MYNTTGPQELVERKIEIKPSYEAYSKAQDEISEALSDPINIEKCVQDLYKLPYR